jgi:hypothetical protein
LPTTERPDQRAQHQRFALAEVERAGRGKGQLVAEGDDGIDHAERDPLKTSCRGFPLYFLRSGYRRVAA